MLKFFKKVPEELQALRYSYTQTCASLLTH